MASVSSWGPFTNHNKRALKKTSHPIGGAYEWQRALQTQPSSVVLKPHHYRGAAKRHSSATAAGHAGLQKCSLLNGSSFAECVS